MGRREIELYLQSGCYLSMTGKFHPTIRRDSFYGKPSELTYNDTADFTRVLLVRLAANGKAILSVDKRNKTCPPRFSCNRVTFPITKSSPMICCVGTSSKFVADTNFSTTLRMPFRMACFSLVAVVFAPHRALHATASHHQTALHRFPGRS